MSREVSVDALKIRRPALELLYGRLNQAFATALKDTAIVLGTLPENRRLVEDRPRR
jgi:hypothetical protein